MIATWLTEVAAGLARGTITSSELVAMASGPDHLHATERVLAAATDEASAADARWARGAALGPLDGVPFAAKANLDIAAVPTSAGTGLDLPPAPADAAAVARLRKDGLIPVRTATLAELAVGSVTDNPFTGSCRNPCNPHLNAGGSSGGSAALVAAGIVPVALGSDTMGSVRIPAAYCGITGYKPTRGVVDTAGLTALCPLLDTVGVLAARPSDLLLIVGLLGVQRAAGGLTPATVGVPSLAAAADADGRRALDAVLKPLRTLGHRRVDVTLNIDVALVRRRGLLLCEADTYTRFAAAVDSADPGLSSRLRGLLAYGRDAGPARVEAARATLEAAAEAVLHAFDTADVLVLPTTPAGPPPIGVEPADAADLTAWVNVAGLPAVAFPAGPPTADGMPRGVQLVGRPGADAQVLALAVAVEAAGVMR